MTMNSALSMWKSVAVFLDETSEGENIGRQAADLAERCGGHLIGIRVLPNYFDEHPAAEFALGREAEDAVLAKQEAEEKEKTLAVRRCFGTIVARRPITSEMRIVGSLEDDEDLVANSRCCDLHVLGYPDLPGLPARWPADRLLLKTGGPMLILPVRGKVPSVGRRTIVAWNASREARRAIRDAMPLLSVAESVTVLVIDPERQRRKFREAPGADLAHYLGLHGVHSEISELKTRGSSVSDTILATMENRQADLVVIGAYSHARVAEKVFGGVTRTLLANARVPLFLST
jgi:nucleotide-binding universal stress UspA family protein